MDKSKTCSEQSRTVCGKQSRTRSNRSTERLRRNPQSVIANLKSFFSPLFIIFLFTILYAINNTAFAITFTTDTTINTSDATYDGQDIVVGNGITPVTLTINGTHSFSNMTVNGSATVTHSETDTSNVYSLNLTITGDLTVNLGGKMDVDGRGYLGGKIYSSNTGWTSGNTTTGGSSNGAGGSYGGLGGNGQGQTEGSVGATYGDSTNPTEPGAGGGQYGNWGSGGDGGGLIRLTINGMLTNNGKITANGDNASGGGSGGGAGGGIYISCGAIAGSGSIEANGGNGGSNSSSGGGGGGRIALQYDTNTFTGSVTAFGGSGINNGENGGYGIVYWKESSQGYGTVMIEGTNARIDATDVAYEGSAIVVGNGSDTASFALNGTHTVHSITVRNNATLTHTDTDTVNTYALNLTVTSALEVQSGGQINVDGRGYLGGKMHSSNTGRTSGNTTTGGSSEGAGGSYGGLGGNVQGQAVGSVGATYGDSTNPTEPGAGGGQHGNWGSGGDGGGLVRLTVNGTLTNNGAITVNGSNADGGGSGGGAGGGIYISCGAIAGSGSIEANGGNGGSNSSSGGGGGGRIALQYDTNTFTGSVTAFGGSGIDNGENGGCGIVYWKGALQSYGTVVVEGSNARIDAKDMAYEGAAVVVGNGSDTASFAMNGTHTVYSLTVKNNATITHTETDTSTMYSMNLTVTGDLEVELGGQINVDGRGYLGGKIHSSHTGRTSGNTTTGGSSNGAGGSYGGLGGNGQGQTEGSVGATYGDTTNPTEPGAGGGQYGNWGSGGDGGGLIRLTINGMLTNNGKITANGDNASGGGSGGGAGGGIYISCGAIAGSGSIEANGGNGGSISNSGGGGGGRIAIYYTVYKFNGDMTALGGSGSNNGENGGEGTIITGCAEGGCMGIVRITPKKGGDTGNVTVYIYGDGFEEGATVKLTKSGESDIEGDSVNVSSDGKTITATFDLTGKARGVWDIEVINPDGISVTRGDAFTIEEGKKADVWIDIIGRSTMRPWRPQAFYLTYGNHGNIDTGAQLFTLSGSSGLEFAFSDGEQFSNTPLLIFGIGQGASAGILSPYITNTYKLFVKATSGEHTVELNAIDTEAENFDWDYIATEGVPDWMSSEDWEKMVTRARTQIGESWKDVMSVLRDFVSQLQLPPPEYFFNFTELLYFVINNYSTDTEEIRSLENFNEHGLTKIGQKEITASETFDPSNDVEVISIDGEENLIKNPKYTFILTHGFAGLYPDQVLDSTLSRYEELGKLVKKCFQDQGIDVNVFVTDWSKGSKKYNLVGFPDYHPVSKNIDPSAQHLALKLKEFKEKGYINADSTIMYGLSMGCYVNHGIRNDLFGGDKVYYMLYGSPASEMGLGNGKKPLNYNATNVSQNSLILTTYSFADTHERITDHQLLFLAEPTQKEIEVSGLGGRISALHNRLNYWLIERLKEGDCSWLLPINELPPKRKEKTVFDGRLHEDGTIDSTLEFHREMSTSVEIKGSIVKKGKSKKVMVVQAYDPNEKAGTDGIGEAHSISGKDTLCYSVFFENVGTATAAAQEITITDQLGTTTVDLDTFSLGDISFGSSTVTPPNGLSEYSTEVDLRPDKNMVVRIDAGLDKNSGLITWHFVAIDPDTNDFPEDPMLGVLSPNITPPEGDGSVFFIIMPKEGLSTGTEIRNKATIVFDTNDPMDTNEWLNTIDLNAVSPTPSPTPIPTPSPTPVPTEPPTVVELVSFSAESGDDGTVILRWQTATEVNNAGFNIYRSRLRNGTYTKVNNSMIPAKGSATSGDSYRLVDEPDGSGTYYYKLEDVDDNGTKTMHGPVKVRVRNAEGEARRR